MHLFSNVCRLTSLQKVQRINVTSLFRTMPAASNEMTANSEAGSGAGSSGGRGALIVLEGCDRAGKTTQCQLLVDALNKSGRPCHLMRFPDRTTEIGKVLDQYLKCTANLSDESIHLLFSSNRWELVPRIRSLLQSGESIVVDRYAFSGVAFSAAKGTLDLEWCMAPDVGLPQPDRVMFLNLSKEAVSLRGGFGEERYEQTEFQEKVQEIFLKINDPAFWTVVNADRTKEEVHEELVRLAIEIIEANKEKPILPLWKESPRTKSVKSTSESGMVL